MGLLLLCMLDISLHVDLFIWLALNSGLSCMQVASEWQATAPSNGAIGNAEGTKMLAMPNKALACAQKQLHISQQQV